MLTVPNRDLIAVGASAGGVEALRGLVHELPADLPACVLVVLHLPVSAFSALPMILQRSGTLDVRQAEDGLPLKQGTVLVAPPDRHLLIRDSTVVLGRGPKENGHRPAVDPLFRSAARWRGPGTVGVVLSGTLDDGAAGLRTIADRGGVAVVQTPESALYDGMPCAALRAVPDAQQAHGRELADLLVRLCDEQVPADPPEPDRDLAMETEIADMGEAALGAAERPGRPAAMTCPDCSGAMFEIQEGSVVRFRCRVGHAWSPESLLAEQVESAEAALWAAIRSLEEKAALHRGLAGSEMGSSPNRAYHAERAEDAQHSASVLREMLRQPLAGDLTVDPRLGSG